MNTNAQRQFPESLIGKRASKKPKAQKRTQHRWAQYQQALANQIDEEIKRAGRWEEYSGRRALH